MFEEENTHKYDDIINQPHPTSTKHPRMSNYDRAAQFSPFAALTGHEDAINETARLTDREIVLDEGEICHLNEKLTIILNSPTEQLVTITYFIPDTQKEGGAYSCFSGYIKKIDQCESTLVMKDNTVIPIDRIVQIDSEIFKNLL